MRVSPIAWRFLNAGGMINEAAKSAKCTHNHPEGVKGAQAVGLAIHYGDELRRLSDKKNKESITQAFRPILDFTGYNINIRRANVLNKFDETCQGTVPVALWIITESTGFEDAIRKAVSLGADADTLGAIVGSIAEAIWGVPTELALIAMKYLPNEMKSVVLRFYKTYAYEIFPLQGYGDEGSAKDMLAEEKPEPEPEVADPWFTGINGKICEGCIYKDGIRRSGKSLTTEIMGCGRCFRETFKKNYESGKCKFRKTDMFIPSEYELERKAVALQRKKERESKEQYKTETRAYVHLKNTYAAGTQFVRDKKPLKKLELYCKVELVRECDNKYDENAVSLYFDGKHVGYVPRRENREIAAMLEAGMSNRLVAYVTKINNIGTDVTFDIAIYISQKQQTERKKFDDTLYFWAGKMLEKLETMPDGSKFSTSDLFDEVSDEYSRMHNVLVSIPDEWELDDLFKTLAKWKGYRIYSSNCPQGLPFYIPMKYKRKVVTCPEDIIDAVTRKPRKCPHCGGAVYRILYGKTVCDAEEYFKRHGEHVILGGCCLTDNDPDWECTDCGHKFRKKHIAPFN